MYQNDVIEHRVFNLELKKEILNIIELLKKFILGVMEEFPDLDCIQDKGIRAMIALDILTI